MINYSMIVLSFLLSISSIDSCKSHHPSRFAIPSKECIELNDEGLRYFEEYPMHGKQDLDKAIDLFKQAIACDTNYIIAYMNLANAYGPSHAHIYTEQMSIYSKVLILTHNDPAILLLKGKVFERMNKIDSAYYYYHLSKINFEQRLIKRPGNVNLIFGLIETKAVIYNADSAIQEINKQIKLHPEISSKISYELYIYQNFNRHDYIFESSSVDTAK